MPWPLLLASAALAGVETAPVPQGLDQAAAPRKVALVVGLNSYAPEAGLHDLKYAAADADAVGNRLERAGYRVHPVLQTATRDEFLSALDDATADLQRNDLFVLYFAGHAQLDPAATGKQLALLFSDDEGVEGDGLQVDELAERIEALNAQRRVVMLDTCYSERTQQMLAMNRGTAPVVTAPAVGRFDAWIFSAAPQQSAQEDPELGHGVFTWFLLQALDGEADTDGDGSVGVLEVYNWVGFKTAERTGRQQVPWIEESRIGWDDLALVEVGGTSEVAAIPWYERVLPGAQVLLNGIPRGPGSVEAGRHDLEVRSADGDLVLKRRVEARSGEVLEWDGWLDASQRTVRVGAGLGWLGVPEASLGDGEVAPAALNGAVGGWYAPRGPRSIRPMIGGQFSAGSVPVDSAANNYFYGSARAGLGWMATPDIAIGPYAGIGGSWLSTSSGAFGSPLVEGGLLLNGDVGPMWIGLEGGGRAMNSAGWTVAPSAAVLVGASFH